VVAGRVGGVEVESARANSSSGGIRAPWRHPEAIGEPERPPTARSDTGEERLLAAEKVVLGSPLNRTSPNRWEGSLPGFAEA
jgi:hypothetical protein